ncbi:sensor histidine kinase [Spirosoma sordidisoli]|uniref:Signal transduction histidine kinase internal region domain-containing protein n=1 Tax=Spirosoma sordidisoli TaxID=2502893 RepID=A0A4Q2UD34_9BACT|nr:histidine kinase [Spirosoma sordidisoli]RYC66987.1 hypothetical protein EQG79_26820 [Spirosoma sordidisoli]
MRQLLDTVYRPNRRLFRVLGHLLMWLVVYVVLIDSTGSRIFEDNERVVRTASVVDFLETVGLYYLLGYYVFPAFIYSQKYLRLATVILVVFFVMYQLNSELFNYLDSISTKVRPDGKPTYATKINAMVREAGWLGCFTSLRVALWNLFYAFGLPIVLLTFKAFRDIISYQRRLVLAERDKLALELNFLKAQVNPHFLFNTLNSIYARIFDTDEPAANLVLQLAELMRYNLYETDQPRIALDKELAYIQNYLNLERNRLADQPITIDYQQQGDAGVCQVAPLLLIAFVENAFKHGIKGGMSNAYVRVDATVVEHRLTFTVVNSVAPRRGAAGTRAKSGGVGLVNVRRRLEALYAHKHTLTITPAADVYRVQLVIDLEPIQETTR